MRHFYIIFCFLCLTTCDDGDIITVELDFDKELKRCINNTDTYLIYDTQESTNQSLSLNIPRNEENELLFTEPTTLNSPRLLSLNGTDTRFIYRTYNRPIVSTGSDEELCYPVPPSDLIVTDALETTTGKVEVTVTIDDDDNDGISSEDEERGEPNDDGEFPNARDWDGDGLPDYLDEDDDNDNVKTIDELDEADADGDDDPFTNPLNTDANLPNGDALPDYLDDDDDGDGTLTRLEDESQDMDPTNDRADNEAGILTAHYLNTLETISYADPGTTDDNKYTRTVTSYFLVTDIDFEIFRATEIDFGTLITSFELPLEDDD